MTAAATTVQGIVRAAGGHVPALLAQVEERLAALAAGHGPVLAHHAGHTIAAGGKRLRPLLVILAAGPRAAGSPELIAAAAAVELIHSATLVHDDVLDAASLRRGVPTVWARGGRALAVATGDLLFSRAFSELASAGSLDAVQALSRATSALAEGELLQRQDAWDGAVAVDRYLLRCELKTARLFEASCQLGALAAHAPAAQVAALGAFGRGIGIAFQLLDDVLDVAGPAQLTGKHRGTDLLDGTVTLPLILARERDRALAAVDLRAVTTAEQAEALCDRIAATGALEAAQARALAIVEEATAQLRSLALDDGQREALSLVASSVADRRA
ncbi:MAG TPA: polyprenyl synthetase family protein [Solirubrobacteraceae bacterium]|nr:polyprenyl synthetase family protein [Solirubrobacteraceae bacterium]